jgi:hypothetical protein
MHNEIIPMDSATAALVYFLYAETCDRYSMKQVAEYCKTTEEVVSDILHRKTWTEATEPVWQECGSFNTPEETIEHMYNILLEDLDEEPDDLRQLEGKDLKKALFSEHIAFDDRYSTLLLELWEDEFGSGHGQYQAAHAYLERWRIPVSRWDTLYGSNTYSFEAEFVGRNLPDSLYHAMEDLRRNKAKMRFIKARGNRPEDIAKYPVPEDLSHW